MIYAWGNLTASLAVYSQTWDVKTDRSEESEEKKKSGMEKRGGSQNKFLTVSRPPSPFHEGLTDSRELIANAD